MRSGDIASTSSPRLRCLLAALTLACVATVALPRASATPPPRRIAVLYFENSGNPELEMLKLGLSEMLIGDLARVDGLRVVERGRLNELLSELDLQKTEKVDQSKAVELGKLLGVERIVLGSYFELMGVFQLMGRVVDVETGEIVGAAEAQGEVKQFRVLQDQLAAALVPYLVDVQPSDDDMPAPSGGLRRGNGSAGRATRAANGGGGSRPPVATGPKTSESPKDGSTVDQEAPGGDSLGAALAFSEGLDYLDRRDISRARHALRRAVELDPRLDEARAELARLDI